MLVEEIINPKTIVVVGGSNDVQKPGGKVLHNIIKGNFQGELFVVNPKEQIVQGVTAFQSCELLPRVDLAIIAVAARSVPEAIEILTRKGTRAFIVLSAGFGEMGSEGKQLERQIVELVNRVNGTLIGPNCIGVITEHYKGVFAGPIPEFAVDGCDFVSASGATAVFILEEAITRGIKFSQIFSVGNSAHVGIEEVLEYWDNTFSANSSKVKLIYAESIANPQKFLKHTRSLIQKGCKIAAIKAGRTAAGSKAASSHTGALAGTDEMIDALFRKAGIIRCEGRLDLVNVAGVLLHKEPKGNRFAVVTHAGGPAVMLTDTLEIEGVRIPTIEGPYADELLSKLHYGSSVSNPIDFLATGTAEHLDIILDFVETKFENIDASVVIFGTPGLFDISDVYKVLNHRIETSSKPIYPVLPSIVQAKNEIELFKSFGRVYFNDEIALGKALGKVLKNKVYFEQTQIDFEFDIQTIRKYVSTFTDTYLPTDKVKSLLELAGFSYVKSEFAYSIEQLGEIERIVGFPWVMKVVGPIHKTEHGGVRINIHSLDEAKKHFAELMQISEARCVEIQEYLQGIELFFGMKHEHNYGHLIMFGLGGIFVEVLKDVANALCPVTRQEAMDMIRSIKGYPLLGGFRKLPTVDEEAIVDCLLRLSKLVEVVPEIKEMDINPAIARGTEIKIVDCRILMR